jgi:transposase
VFTSGFEELAAYLAQVTDRTSVSRLLGISWATVGNIVERVVARRLDGARFAKLRRIGVDEFSYRKRHHYLTLVVDHDRQRVVWAGKGRSAQTLEAFFDRLGPAGCERLQLVTADLAASWQKALRARVPHARVVFDRFHVERLAADALDEVRRAEQHRLGKQAKQLKGMRYPLLKHPARLKPGEERRLAALRRQNRALGRAYELKECLAAILGEATPEDGQELLDEWLAWASRSRLAPFVKLAKTVRKHAAGILAYLDTKMTNGIVEGINNKLRVIARRAYGFHSHGALISMLFLCCGGIQLAPPLPTRV